MVNITYLLLGSNLGDKQVNLEKATTYLANHAGLITRKSSIYETMPWGVSGQPSYWNQVVRQETALSPEELLQVIHSIEQQMGRERRIHYESRIIDIDILYYNDIVLETANLTIPHPQMTRRRFTLVPLAEIAPYLKHPVLHYSSQELLQLCKDNLEVVKLEITN
jgi:2-amino-4-hydroxy-6-hydroxymethyldihydropteridine diphosphokinase